MVRRLSTVDTVAARRPGFAGLNESRTSNPRVALSQEGGFAGGTSVPSALKIAAAMRNLAAY
jgi:hypothetical protein